jgi:hypothetical protein
MPTHFTSRLHNLSLQFTPFLGYTTCQFTSFHTSASSHLISHLGYSTTQFRPKQPSAPVQAIPSLVNSRLHISPSQATSRLQSTPPQARSQLHAKSQQSNTSQFDSPLDSISSQPASILGFTTLQHRPAQPKTDLGSITSRSSSHHFSTAHQPSTQWRLPALRFSNSRTLGS